MILLKIALRARTTEAPPTSCACATERTSSYQPEFLAVDQLVWILVCNNRRGILLSTSALVATIGSELSFNPIFYLLIY